jgi:hypothetical protein
MGNWMTGINDALSGKTTTEELPPNVTPPPAAGTPPPKAPDKKTEEKPNPPPVAKPVEISDKERAEVRQKITEGHWPRSAQEWEKFKAVAREDADLIAKERDEFKNKYTEAEKRLADTSKTVPADYEAVKKERDEFDKALRQVAVSEHPKFKAYYDGKEGNQIELAKRIVGTEKADKIAELLKAPESGYRDEQLSQLIDELPPIQQSRIGGVLNAITEIRTERQGEIEKAREGFTAIQEENKKRAQGFKEQIEKTFESQVAQFQAKEGGNPLYQKKDGDDAWNKAVDERIAVAKGYVFGSLKPEQMTSAALNAAATPALIQEILTLEKEASDLRAQIAALTKANPTVGGDRTKPAAGSEEGNAAGARVEVKPGMRPMDATSKWMSALPKF